MKPYKNLRQIKITEAEIKTFLEKRKNPDQNPFVGAWDYVEEYKDNPDVYISFTEIDKIGINPQSRFNTPVGIYCYPLKEFVETYVDVSFKDLENFANDFFKEAVEDVYKKSIGDFAPYAGTSKYVNFIKLKDKSNFINDMYKDYGSSDYDRDIKILEKKYNIKQITALDVKNFIEDYLKYLNGLDFSHSIKSEKDVLAIIKKIKKIDLFNSLPKIHQKGIVEDTITFFDKSLTKLKTILGHYLYENVGQDVITKGIAEAKVKNPMMSIWNITRLLATELSNNAKQASTKWNLILSKDLGYSGFADKSGKGYIHPSEPMQAVFLRKNAFKLLHRVENKPAKTIDLVKYIKLNPEKFKDIKNPSEELQIAVVGQDGMMIEDIKNPSEKVQLIAVEEDPSAIAFIKNPSEKVQIVALNGNPWSILYIKNPSFKIQKMAVDMDKDAYNYITNKSQKIIDYTKSLYNK